MKVRYIIPLAVGVLLLMVLITGGNCRHAPTDIVIPKQLGGSPHRDVTFFVASDTHFGQEGIDALNRRQIAAMNALPEKAWPGTAGETIAEPRGVVITGDLTDHGLRSEWQGFLDLYGLRGEAELNWPVYLLTGNHDRVLKIYTPVLSEVEAHHGALLHGWIWDDVLFLALDEYPDGATLQWLERQLSRAGPDMPMVLFMHYGLTGPFSDWWEDDEKQAFADAIAEHNIVAIFHGHYHRSMHYRWEGVDVFNVGSPRHSMHSFAAVRITDEAMQVASWNWDAQGWQWSRRIPLKPAVPKNPALVPATESR